LDVGGTSADVAVVRDGAPQRRYRGEVAGMPVALPQVDVLPIGAGGGSLAAVDAFGSLRVGPGSAGADPGPAACGGVHATVTDAHLVHGTLDSAGLLGGALALHPERARRAVHEDVAAPLGLSVEEAAGSILRIADGRMADALRAVTVARGIDVRDFALMAFGGAGPMHACAIAADLGIRRVIVPRHPGLTSAMGLLMGDGGYEISRTRVSPLERLDHDALDTLLAEMVAEATRLLADAGIHEEPEIGLDLDLRYAGQAYELTVPAPAARLRAADVPGVREGFHRAHEAVHGHARPRVPVELVTLRVRARLPRAAADWVADPVRTDAVPEGVRDGVDRLGRPVCYRVIDRANVSVGLAGPAIVSQPDTTTLLPARWRVVRVDVAGMVLERDGTGDEGSAA
ncbi:MAG: hydantoinase/oxoprolinase family protein, partial [Microbacterium sp.]